MAQAKQEKRRRQLKEREAGFRRAVEQEEAYALAREAQQAYLDGNPSAASGLLKKALLRDPHYAGALGLLGQIHYDAGRDSDALY
jgi:hypothetical protein